MSDLGLFTILYDEIREQAELLDQILLKLKTGGSNVEDADRQKLAQILEDMAQGQTTDLSTQMLELSLRASAMNTPTKWKRVAEQLRARTVEKEAVEMLESVANSLEVQRAGTVARMRGRAR